MPTQLLSGPQVGASVAIIVMFRAHNSHRWSGSGHSNLRHYGKHYKKNIHHIDLMWVMTAYLLRKKQMITPRRKVKQVLLLRLD